MISLTRCSWLFLVANSSASLGLSRHLVVCTIIVCRIVARIGAGSASIWLVMSACMRGERESNRRCSSSADRAEGVAAGEAVSGEGRRLCWLSCCMRASRVAFIRAICGLEAAAAMAAALIGNSEVVEVAVGDSTSFTVSLVGKAEAEEDGDWEEAAGGGMACWTRVAAVETGVSSSISDGTSSSSTSSEEDVSANSFTLSVAAISICQRHWYQNYRQSKCRLKRVSDTRHARL